MRSNNPYVPCNVSDTDHKRSTHGAKRLVAVCTVSIAVYLLTTAFYLAVRLEAPVRDRAGWRAAVIEAIDMSICLAAVAVGAAVLYPACKITIMRATITSAACLFLSLIVCSVLTTLIGLDARTYHDDPGEVFRPVATLIIFSLFLILARSTLHRFR